MARRPHVCTIAPFPSLLAAFTGVAGRKKGVDWRANDDILPLVHDTAAYMSVGRSRQWSRERSLLPRVTLLCVPSLSCAPHFYFVCVYMVVRVLASSHRPHLQTEAAQRRIEKWPGVPLWVYPSPSSPTSLSLQYAPTYTHAHLQA